MMRETMSISISRMIVWSNGYAEEEHRLVSMLAQWKPSNMLAWASQEKKKKGELEGCGVQNGVRSPGWFRG
jgi:hypothetical protein